MKFYPSREEYIKQSLEYNQIPVYVELQGDLYTAISLFFKIRKRRYHFLLESAVSGKYMGRYSFMGNSGRAIRCKDGVVSEVNDDNEQEIGRFDKPFEYLRQYFSSIETFHNPNLPPFASGVVGYFGYDCIKYFEKIDLTKDDPASMQDFELIIAERMLIYDNLTHRLYCVASPLIETDENPSIAYDRAVNEINNLLEELNENTPEFESFKVMRDNGKIAYKSNFTKERFMQAVEKAKEHIRLGDIFQVVLSQRLRVPVTGDVFEVYRSLRIINPSPYMFYLRCGDVEIIGSSPEIHVRVNNDIIMVRPIAGTRPRGKTPDEDREIEKELLADEKEMAEHLMLVDLARNDIGRVSTGGSVHVEEFSIVEHYSHVMHIVSQVSGHVAPGKDVFDCIEATFPAGTVSGAPKIRAMELISEIENERRGVYAGMVGHFTSSGDLDSCITIRTIIVKDGIAYLQAGAGIVADSVPEKEYYETIHKIRAMARALENAEQGGDNGIAN